MCAHVRNVRSVSLRSESDGPPLDDYYSNGSDSDSSGLAAKLKALIVAAEQEEKKYRKHRKKARKTL
jgi:hypothetical protein